MLKLQVSFIAIHVVSIKPSSIIEGTEPLFVNKYFPNKQTAIDAYIDEALKHGLSKRLGHTIKLVEEVIFNPADVSLTPGQYPLESLVLSTDSDWFHKISEDNKYLIIE